MKRYYLHVRYLWLLMELVIAIIQLAGDSPLEGALMLFCVAALAYYFYLSYKIKRYGTSR